LLKQSLDEWLLAAETGQQRQVHVDRFPRFAPALHRQAADEAEPPAFRLAQRLKVGSRADQLNHVDRPS
jgi:hypothetical protein